MSHLFNQSDNIYVEKLVLTLGGLGTESDIVTGSSSQTHPGKFDKPMDILVNRLGYIYVADTNNNRIQKFDKYGNFIMLFGEAGAEPGQFVRPIGMFMDAAEDKFFVIDRNADQIKVFALPGN